MDIEGELGSEVASALIAANGNDKTNVVKIANVMVLFNISLIKILKMYNVILII